MSLPPRQFLRKLLESEKGQKDFMNLYNDLMTKRKETIKVPVVERQVELNRLGETKRVVKQRTVPQEVEIERYAAKDVIALLGFIASFGIGKPPEEKNVQVNITATQVKQMSDEELYAIVDGNARELTTGE